MNYFWPDVGRSSQEQLPASAVGAFTGAVFENGEVVNHPPLEMHHLHVGTDLRDTLMFQAHTDTQCADADGGTDCLFWRYPDGYGLYFEEHLQTLGTVNDVRSHGDPMTFYIEIGVVLTTKKVEHLSMSANANPYLARNLITHGSDTYLHEAAATALMWYSVDQPMGGSHIYAICHSHWEWTSQSMLFNARPSQLGLAGEPLLVPSQPWDEIDLNRVGYTPEKVRALLFGSLARAQHEAKLEPSWDGAAPGFVGACSPPWDGEFPRVPLLPNFRVNKGDVLTLVTFHAPRSAHAAKAGTTRMHSVFITHWIRDDKASTYEYIKGAQDPSWTWKSAVGGWYLYQVLYAKGGPFGPQNPTESTSTLANVHAVILTASEVFFPGSSPFVNAGLVVALLGLVACIAMSMAKRFNTKTAESTPKSELV